MSHKRSAGEPAETSAKIPKERKVIYLLVGTPTSHNIIKPDFRHTMAVLAHRSLCLANGVPPERIFTASTTTLPLFVSGAQAAKIDLKCAYAAPNSLPVPQVSGNFDYEDIVEKDLLKIIQGTKASNISATKKLVVQPGDTLVVKLFGHGTTGSGALAIRGIPLSTQFWKALTQLTASILVDMTQCKSRRYLSRTVSPIVQFFPKILVSASTKELSDAEYIPSLSVSSPVIPHFSLYIGASLVALGLDGTMKDYFNQLKAHYCCNDRKRVIMGNDLANGFSVVNAGGLEAQKILEILGYDKAATKHWLNTYFFGDFSAIDKMIVDIKSGGAAVLRDFECDSLEQESYTLWRRNRAESREEFGFWATQLSVTRAEYQWVKHILREACTKLNLGSIDPMDPVGPVTKEFRDFYGSVKEILVRFSVLDDWFAEFEGLLFALSSSGIAVDTIIRTIQEVISTIESSLPIPTGPHPSALRTLELYGLHCTPVVGKEYYLEGYLAISASYIFARWVISTCVERLGIQLSVASEDIEYSTADAEKYEKALLVLLGPLGIAEYVLVEERFSMSSIINDLIKAHLDPDVLVCKISDFLCILAWKESSNSDTVVDYNKCLLSFFSNNRIGGVALLGA